MITHATRTNSVGALRAALLCGCLGLGVGVVYGGNAAAQSAPPTEHKGLSVKTLGTMPEGSVKATVGLEGHILLLREITIAPGGQIAKHSHATFPGIVQVVSGEWIEGREDGERSWTADTPALLEDENTVNWFFNRGTEPATAIVCDIKPAK
ncbi:MAG TPA: cupin domain-containing protein [Thermohalobaculum sp.]|nr:cupin domain-containing protein [Thermohalobaculum sp.]